MYNISSQKKTAEVVKTSAVLIFISASVEIQPVQSDDQKQMHDAVLIVASLQNWYSR